MDLIQQLVDKHGYTKKAATSVIDDFTDIVLDNLRDGNAVSIYGFGCFDILERKARTFPSVQTGETMTAPTHWIPRFYPWTKMKTVVKLWEDDTKRGLK